MPQIWDDPTTSDARRKALLRCLIDKVILDCGDHDIAVGRIVWRGGAVTRLEVKMRVTSLSKLARGEEMRQRALALAREGIDDDAITAVLTSEGHRSPTCEDKVLPVTVQKMRLAEKVELRRPRTRWTHGREALSAPELAAKLSIPVNWLYVQIRKQRLMVDRQRNGAYIFSDTEDVLKGVLDLRNHAIGSLDLRSCQPDQEGHQYG
ncbi:hypothetical protein MSC49_40790 (plasmid) [Methylosinus sp. C49]|uniref:hypothetical protein n=1 Tax=Methylosinus sp. C49 TaxID=2699395 RepID=UPI0013670930|nr:hypothetical protein [Methylosinus sp. C49]BBU64144.1 hypothetical protein MSC49_40790 [Methylosinus sp. C49]